MKGWLIIMVKTLLHIDGMMCGMCESHINDAVRCNFNVKKVVSSHSKNTTEIISETELDRTKLEQVIKDTGYELKGIETSPYEKKKGFLGLFH